MHFDGTVTAGNLLTAAAMFVAMIAAGFAIYSRLKNTVTLESCTACNKMAQDKATAIAVALSEKTTEIAKEVARAAAESAEHLATKASENAAGINRIELMQARHEERLDWIMKSIVAINAVGIKMANPTPAELPPWPQGMDDPEE